MKIENTFIAFIDHRERGQNPKFSFTQKNFIRRLNEQKTVFWPYFECLGENTTPPWILTAGTLNWYEYDPKGYGQSPEVHNLHFCISFFLETAIQILRNFQNEKILKLKRKKLKKNKKRKFNDAGLGQKLKFDCFFSNIHSHKL